jgi:peptidoglycan/xylan/chitin deacetylase (PgdA/CDA1 family)
MRVATEIARWGAKKAGRLIIGGGSAVLQVPQKGQPRVRVLTYHRFGRRKRDPFCLDPDLFSVQMRWLASTGRAVSLEQARAFLNGASLPDGSILVTIDDGDLSVLEIALPVLREFNVPAVVFVIAGELGKGSHISAAQLRTLGDGVDVGSHSLTHRSMASLTPSEAALEALESRRVLETILERPVTSFAYPYGTQADFNARTASLLSESGYEIAFTSQHGALTPGLPSFALPRIKVEAGDPAWLFPCLCSGAMDAWRFVDATLWRLQKPVFSER